VEFGRLVEPKKEPAKEAVPADGDVAARYARRCGVWELRHIPIAGDCQEGIAIAKAAKGGSRDDRRRTK